MIKDLIFITIYLAGIILIVGYFVKMIFYQIKVHQELKIVKSKVFKEMIDFYDLDLKEEEYE